mmetsp:Transcript_48990/g.98007  ORF Transcript_48990/g.98007 Transcript_48990/m.98007 type:complete len:359 (+) Transcript_48990:140-1216(+)|eukprot:CAMPEP_0196734086 /NCGR_PEP_ID=MMETSP1091-20130531/12924_1 /TAXON_ID=302021 /ORGANISM="Rhodomonas sp., Strain CCMP768" /LENGTH=358 /DNA_ID=CAMNT_0042077543 /DNA_START=142 /DNA_END=1218 /DNA_ORIENTATION=+
MVLHDGSSSNTVTDLHRDRDVAFAMTLHARLGRNSTAQRIGSDELCHLICNAAKKPVICVVGGKDPSTNESIPTVECYEPDSETWAVMEPMPYPRRGLAAVSLDQRLYVVGGQYTGAYTSPTGKAPMYCTYHANAMVQSFSDRYGDWRSEEPLPTARSYLAATVAEGGIYALGGFEGTQGNRYLATVERYSPAEKQWKSCATLPKARSHLASATLKGQVLALGGYADGMATSTVERYEPVADRWVEEKGMPTARDSLASSELMGRVYALGGCTSGSVTSLATVESYDVKSGKWQSEAPMPNTRALLGAVTLNDRIFVIGGSMQYDCQRAVHSYEPRMNAWTEEAPMLSSRIGVAIAVV